MAYMRRFGSSSSPLVFLLVGTYWRLTSIYLNGYAKIVFVRTDNCHYTKVGVRKLGRGRLTCRNNTEMAGRHVTHSTKCKAGPLVLPIISEDTDNIFNHLM